MNHLITKQLVQKILENPSGYNWSLQGFGMLRLYLSLEVRLHVWDSRFRVPDVSLVHNHPWDFDSYIVAGVIQQRRFLKTEGSTHLEYIIKAGPGGFLVTNGTPVKLQSLALERYEAGESYTQKADEIHESLPMPGTVTLVTRSFTKEDVDHACTYTCNGVPWVSAEPRPATEKEVHAITSFALERWFTMK
jgi:hypothetical protein